jgi:hypothetical protein
MTKKNMEKPSDIEIAIFHAFHIMNPCSVIVNGKREDIRGFYIKESKRILPTLNPYAKSFLESVIGNYVPNDNFTDSSQ